MSNARKPKSARDNGSTRDAIIGGVARTSVQEVVGRADAIIQGLTQRIDNQRASMTRVMTIFKRAEEECTCGAIDRAMEAVSEQVPEEAAASESSGD